MIKRNVLVVMVSYKSPKITADAIHQVLSQRHPVNLVVWDNGGFNSQYLAERFPSAPGLTIHHSEENLYWTPALNAAMDLYLKDEEYILFMNNDIILPSIAVGKLIDTLESIPDAGAVGPPGAGLGGLQDFASHYGELSTGLTETQDLLKNQPPRRATYLIGACMMIKREVWEVVGRFDDNMPLSGDDFDYSMRIKEAGYSIWVPYNVYVNHHTHSSGGDPAWNEVAAASWDYFNAKWDGYYATSEEAIGSLWGSVYNPDYPVGTGWSAEKYHQRIILGVI